MSTLAWITLFLALTPLGFGVVNLLMQARARGTPPDGTLVSILIPARDEEANIAACLEAALASSGVAVEVVVMDDGSRDRTAEIVRAIAARDPRVRLETCPPLPSGWTGKVHACQRLADAARGTHLLFLDADVRLAPGAAAAMAGHAATQDIALVTGVPRQEMRTLGELLTVPAINLLMLGYLPGAGRAFTKHPALAAACGQLMLIERRAYDAAGGHAAVRALLHDGIAIARRLREAGFRTEVVHGAPLATCRMYRGFAESWRGFVKNAHEGMATPVGLPVWTTLLLGAHVLPWILLPLIEALVAVLITMGVRAAITARVRETWWTLFMHPATVVVAVAIQWASLVRRLRGKKPAWKGRDYQPASGA
jgi:cellulose synthase/poly-beta-1,6-N-acetylglucosamine synthase-like glycosyltransferase